MSHLLYTYIAEPTGAQVGEFLHALTERGVSITHLGKSDPPRKFGGAIEEAVAMVIAGTDLTVVTFARDAARKLHLTFEIRRDPRWTHSTVSATCPDTITLTIIAEVAAAAFDSFITIRGISTGDKHQPWEVVHVTERCPDALRRRFVAS